MTTDDDKTTGEPTGPASADGWIDSAEEPTAERRERPWPDFDRGEDQLPARVEQHARQDEDVDDEIDEGKALAVLSHLSILFGIPVFLVPMLQRDNAFALHHAKSAGVIFVAFLLALSLSMVTCGLAMPLALLVYVPALVGIVNASRGEEAGPWAFGKLGEKMFASVTVDE